MGDFRGHFGPGMFFLIGALFLLFRGLPLRFTRPLRVDRYWLLVPPLVALCGSSVMGMGEMITAATFFGNSHVAHYRLNFAVFSWGAITLMHMFQLLPGAFWGLVPGLSWITMGVLMGAHHQSTLTLTIAHIVSSNLFHLWGVASMLDYLSGLYAPHTDLPSQDQAFTTSFAKSSGMFPSYGNLGMYLTPAPLVHGYVALLNGVWWIMLGFVFYLEADDGLAYPLEFLNDHMQGPMMIYGMVYNLVMSTTAVFVVVALLTQYYDRHVYAGVRVAEC